MCSFYCSNAWTNHSLLINSSFGILFLYCHSETPQPCSPLIVYLDDVNDECKMNHNQTFLPAEPLHHPGLPVLSEVRQTSLIIYDPHLNTEPPASSSQPEPVVSSVLAPLPQVPGLNAALLHRHLDTLLTYPAHLNQRQCPRLTHHSHEPSQSTICREIRL